MIASILVALLDPMDQPVAFDCAGANVEVAAYQLGKQAGLHIVAGPSVKKEIVFVRVRQMPTRKILDEITRVLGASWTETDGKILLFRSDAQEKAQVAAERKLKLDALKAWRDAPPTNSPFTEERARSLVRRAETSVAGFVPGKSDSGKFQIELLQIAKEGPAPISAARLRKSVDINLMADVGTGKRVTFSTQPNRLQKHLRGGDSAIREYSANLDLMRTFSEASLARVPSTAVALDPRQWPSVSSNAPDRAMVAAYRLPGLPQILIRTYFLSGSLIVGWVSEAVDPVGANAVSGTWSASGLKSKDPMPSVNFTVSPDLAKLTRFDPTPETRAVGLPLLEQRREPASWIVGPLLKAYAEARNVDLIACVPDQAADAACGLQIQGSNAMPHLTGLVRRFWNWKESGGLMTLTPDLPVEARASAFDRDRFWKLSDEFRSKGQPSLEQVGAYLAQESVEPVHGVLLSRMTSWSTGVPWGFGEWYNAPPIRFWGRLPFRAKSGSIPMSQITGHARTALNEWIFGTNLGLQALDVSDASEGLSIKRLEPTEMLPDGFPNEMMVSSKIADTPTLWRRFGANEFATRLEECYDVLGNPESLEERVAISSRRVLHLTFEHGISMRVQVDEPDSPVGLKWGPVSGLPTDALKTLKDLAEKYRQEPSKRGTPPPLN